MTPIVPTAKIVVFVALDAWVDTGWIQVQIVKHVMTLTAPNVSIAVFVALDVWVDTEWLQEETVRHVMTLTAPNAKIVVYVALDVWADTLWKDQTVIQALFKSINNDRIFGFIWFVLIFDNRSKQDKNKTLAIKNNIQ